jgi:hypothetical protein
MSIFGTRILFGSGGGHGGSVEAPLEKDRPPAVMLAVLLVLLVVFLVIVALGSSQLLRWANDGHTADTNKNYPHEQLNEQRALDLKRLSEFSKNESGGYIMPIDSAKAVLLKRGSAGPLK